MIDKYKILLPWKKQDHKYYSDLLPHNSFSFMRQKLDHKYDNPTFCHCRVYETWNKGKNYITHSFNLDGDIGFQSFEEAMQDADNYLKNQGFYLITSKEELKRFKEKLIVLL